MVALFVILFVVVLLSIDLIIQARQKQYPLMAAVPKSEHAFTPEHVRIPRGVFFHPGHTWARMQSGDEVIVGVDDFIRKAIGSIDRITLPILGQQVKQGDPVITIQNGARMLSLVAPVDGRVYAINSDAQDNPALIMDNPYESGWLFMVEPSKLAQNLTLLAIAESAVSWVKNEAIRLREFVTSHTLDTATVGETMMDGGLPVAGSIELLDEGSLKMFEQEFLR